MPNKYITDEESGENFQVVFECVVGSTVYGTNTPESDVDIKGVFIQPLISKEVNGQINQIIVDKDTVYFEYSRFLDLLAVSNPTALELLFVQEKHILIKFVHPCYVFDYFKNSDFLTKAAISSHANYAINQIKKARGLDKKINYENNSEFSKRKDVLDFCTELITGTPIKQYVRESWNDYGGSIDDYVLTKIDRSVNCYNVYYFPNNKGMVGDDSNELRTTAIPKGKEVHVGIINFNHGAYKEHCKKYKEYQKWLKSRNTQRYVDVNNHGQKIDGKNLLHCVRLIETAKDILIHNDLILERPNADFLLDIRKGKMDLNDIIDHSMKAINDLDKLMKSSELPDTVNKEIIKKYKYEARKNEIR